MDKGMLNDKGMLDIDLLSRRNRLVSIAWFDTM